MGAVPTIRLTELTVVSLKSEADQVDYYCDRTPRFGVRVSKLGSKTFFVIGRTAERRTAVTDRWGATHTYTWDAGGWGDRAVGQRHHHRERRG